MTFFSPLFRSVFGRWLPVPVVALGALLGGCKPGEATTAASPAASAASAAPAAAPAGTDVAKAKGRWLRPDGGYILAVTTIEADGRAEAGYFNPNPIRVAWATVKSEGGVIKVTAELRDENYPGCIYKLNYLPDKDRLVGTYFQAQQQQTYEVEFVRAP